MHASTITISSAVVTKRGRMADLLNVRRFNYSKRHDGPLHVWPYTSKNQTSGPHRCEELDCRSLTVPIGWILLALFFGFRLIVPMWYKSSFWPTILQSDNQTNSVKDPLVPSVRTINLETHSRHPHDPWIVDTTRPTTTSHSLFIPSGPAIASFQDNVLKFSPETTLS